MRTPCRTLLSALILIATWVLTGCWSAPVATVQPRGEPRLIQSAIPVKSVKPPATIQSINRDARVITVLGEDPLRPVSYKVGSSVRNLKRLQVGDRVRATVAEDLTVYVLRDGQAPPASIDASRVDARVLSVDGSYRLLTLRFPNGYDETFKVGQSVKLDEMEAGDAVSITPVEAIALRRKR
jgi:hypothetical protein